ncbi:hypothetical protein PHLGIDRAFT_33625 [Phlebiopsis gigantea 11061_1 CR5-6]|uniref:RING-type E3 ubiquitin transferase n=1 Tax=Phlebiopsis gigantea (strain 11061_1 CR5-6) TaxID=745531 RepID=A0A0C3SCF3_PHLG1|nr:hypothetical protein PHLGIDRAFT_33625 [Phlebiopsis gigantea 11061_1 CR5-6]
MATPSVQRPTRVFIRDNRGNMEVMDTFPDDLPAELERAGIRTRNTRPVPGGLWGKILVFIGQVGPDARLRSKLMSFVWSASFGLVQFVVITTLLVYSSKHESPTMPGESEWKACERPLGTWNTIWIIRNFFACSYAYWTWRVEVKADQLRRGLTGSSRSPDLENTLTARPARHPRHNTRAGRDPMSPLTSNFDVTMNDERHTRPATPPVYLARLGNLTDALGIVWFLTAHILVYTSVKTCRFAAPHLWWLSFSIICILYFMILEVFLVGLVVFIFWPVFYLAWNIFLLCIGRHPMQRTPLKHQIGEVPQSVVDQIPLVLYIPSPPDESSPDPEKEKDGDSPSVPYTYPPHSGKQPVKKRRFVFFRRSKKTKSGSRKGRSGDEDGEPQTWEDNWVPGDYPFVRLEGHRASCAICLLDYEPPRRKGSYGSHDTAAAPKVPASPPSAEPEVQEVQVDELTQEDADRLKLEDAGEGAQPLRLLWCGHVFHKTCIDPWLTDVSGRCPICQRSVQEPKKGTK